jgi:lipid A 4'-phosphatase
MPPRTEQNPNRRLTAHLIIWPALLLAAGTLASWIFPLDQRLAAFCYSTTDNAWLGNSIHVVKFLQWYGDYPSVLLGIASIWLAVVGVGYKDLEPWRRAGLYLVLSLALCHLLVNPVLKKHYNRARPRETALCGGQRPYTPVLAIPRGDEKGRSFPSGHAAAGFAFVAIYFAFRDRHPALARSGLLLGLAHGLVNGAGRVLQGAHFPTDVLWSFGVVWFTCWGLYRWWYRPSLTPRE